jgi:hypothetical protein
VFVNLSGNNNGVSFIQGTSLTIRDSSFTGLPNAAVYVNLIGSRSQVINSFFDRNGAGVRVFGGLVTVMGSHFENNTVAVEAAGAGTTGSSGAGVSPPNGTTRVYVTGGSIVDNTTAFHMDSPGTRVSGDCNGKNIFLHNSNGGYTIQQRGNPTNVTVTGTADLNGGCTFPQGYDVGQYNPQPYNNTP